MNGAEKEEAVGARVKVAAGAVGFAVVAPLAYLAHRLYEHVAGASITFEWRCLIATGIGALFGVLAYLQAGRGSWLQDDGGVAPRARVAAVIWTIVVLFISWRWP